MLIDSHAHLDSERYADDREAMLRRAWEAGVGTVLAIGIGEQAAGMDGALAVCREFNGQADGMPQLYASAGVYPHNATEIDDSVLAKLDGLLAEPEVIACGEIGLDYYHEGAPHPCTARGAHSPTRNRSRAQAADSDPLPAEGRADRRLGRSLRDSGGTLAANRPGRRDALLRRQLGAGARSLDLGFLVSFAGNLTYPKAQPLRDVAARLPLDGLLVETDAPWLAPAPNRGKRNEPAWVAQTAQALAG